MTYELYDAFRIAAEVIQLLDPVCSRLKIAGSIRRNKPFVKDIEIVCEPDYHVDNNLFGDETRTNMLDHFDYTQIGHVERGGEKYKKIIHPEGISIDLFIVTPPAQWGVIFMLRTGPAEFSKWMVTQRNRGGALPSDCRVSKGAVWRDGKIIEMPNEMDYFELCGVDCVEPHVRCVKDWQRSVGDEQEKRVLGYQ